ncbi:kinase-like domain-containing protein [Blastocladiella britannica]|nr:kinase-like domain-containing protein [Blastocladiella britannica]
MIHPDLESPIAQSRGDDKEDLLERYDFGTKLGRGSFGTVRIVTDKISREIYACKSIQKRAKNGASIEQIAREVEVMKRIRHPHVVGLHEVYETPAKLYIIMEYVSGGELVKKVQHDGGISEVNCKLIISRLASVVGYLHDHGIVHRDIKPENILLSTQDPNDPFNIKMSDFGLAAFTGGGKLMENVCGTPLYMAPEVIAGLGYSQQCDIWSIGIMMALLLQGYTKSSEQELREMVFTGDIDLSHALFASACNAAKNLLDRMLQNDPAKRIAAKEILLHPWITGKRFESCTVLEMMRSYRAEQRWKKAYHVVLACLRFRRGCSSGRLRRLSTAHSIHPTSDPDVMTGVDSKSSTEALPNRSLLLAIPRNLQSEGDIINSSPSLQKMANASNTSPTSSQPSSVLGLAQFPPVRRTSLAGSKKRPLAPIPVLPNQWTGHPSLKRAK